MCVGIYLTELKNRSTKCVMHIGLIANENHVSNTPVIYWSGVAGVV